MNPTKTLQIVLQAKDEASKTLQQFQKNTESVESTLKTAAIAFAAIGGTAIAAGKSFVDAAGFVEQQRAAFRTLIGDVGKADKIYSDLVNFAAKTPFQIPQILEQSKRLLAMGTSSEDLVKTFGMLGDVASGVGMEKLPQLVLAFGQIQSKGKLAGTELRQLTEAGFNLADAMGISNKDLDTLVSKGQVGFDDVKKAFEKVTGEGGRFNGLMEKLNQTTPGQLSNLSDNFFKLKAALGDALLPVVNELLKVIGPLLTQFTQFVKDNPKLVAAIMIVATVLGFIGAVVLIVGPIVAALGAIFAVLSGIISGVIGVIGAIVAILGGPLTVIIVVVLALVALFALAWKNNWLGIRDVVNKVVDWIKNTAVPWISNAFDVVKDAVAKLYGWFSDKFNKIKDVIQSVINTITNLIDKAKQIGGGIASKIGLSFQHGGFVPGGFGDAVPAMLHGGERVISRTGTDVNPSTAGGANVVLNFTGDISMDSPQRVQELADKITAIIGRQSELAAKGVGY